MNIQGSTALVTGGAGGIGRRIAEALIARGATKVYGVDLPDSDFEFLSGLGAGVVPMTGNVTDEADAARLAAGNRSLRPWNGSRQAHFPR